MNALWRIAILILAVVSVVAALWVVTYPSSADPKNIRYVLWKMNVYPWPLDSATSAMIGDPDRDGLVIGKTKAQLRSRFGRLTAPTDASGYLRGCYQKSDWRDQDACFIGSSSWLVLFEGERAVKLVLVKGC